MNGTATGSFFYFLRLSPFAFYFSLCPRSLSHYTKSARFLKVNAPRVSPPSFVCLSRVVVVVVVVVVVAVAVVAVCAVGVVVRFSTDPLGLFLGSSLAQVVSLFILCKWPPCWRCSVVLRLG